MEFSFSQASAIERLTHYPQVEIKELARALAGLDPSARNDEIPHEKLNLVGSYTDYLIRVNRNLHATLKSQGKLNELDLFYPKYVATNSPIEADILFSSCYVLLEKEFTPEVIIEKCISSLCKVYLKYGDSIVYQCGGENATLIAKEKSQDRRGLHKKSEENTSLYKIIGLLAINLSIVKAENGSAKWLNKNGNPSIDPLYKLLSDYSEKNGISRKGMGKSSFYDKLRTSLASLHDE